MKSKALGDFTLDKRVLVLAAMALVVGTGGVASAWVLLRLITLCTNVAYFHDLSLAPHDLADTKLGPASILVPVIGAVIIGLMARYGSEKIRGHGIPEAMEAILIGRSRIGLKVAVLKPLSSAISIGTGGPFGAEGPIIMTGGAIGSLFAQLFNMTAAERKVLLVAGAAAGMTAVFGTPIAAVLLAVELLLFEWKPRSFIPVVVACVTAAIERGGILPAVPLFPHAGSDPDAAGIRCRLAGDRSAARPAVRPADRSWSMAPRMRSRMLPIHWMWWPAIGGVVVGIGGLIDPAALGVGYDNIARLLDGHLMMHAVLLLLVVKAVIWAVALGSGTSGGVLAPLLIMGGALGALAGERPAPAGPGFWALLGHGGDDGRHHARAADRVAVRRRTDRRLRRHRPVVRRLRDQLRGDRAAPETLHPDREDRPARPPHRARVQRRSVRPDRGAGRDGDAGRHAARRYADRRGRGLLHRLRTAP